MRLSMRDAFATAFVAAGILAAVSVTAAWTWPLLSGVRMGVIVLGLAGVFACSASGWGGSIAAGSIRWTNPFILVGSVVGVLVTALGLIGLVTDEAVYLELMIVATAVLWLVTLTHRLFGIAFGGPAKAA